MEVHVLNFSVTVSSLRCARLALDLKFTGVLFGLCVVDVLLL